MAITVGIAIASWLGISTAADRGIARLATIEAERARCDTSWQAARTYADTIRVDRIALRDTIDPQSATAFTTCGSLRDKSAAGTPNPREMNGEPMPQGLR
jgi:hypothetical protein